MPKGPLAHRLVHSTRQLQGKPGGCRDCVEQRGREGRNSNTLFSFIFSWNRGSGRKGSTKKGEKEEKKKKGGKKVLARRMWKSQKDFRVLRWERGVYFSVTPSASGVFPEQTVQLLQIHTAPVSCQPEVQAPTGPCAGLHLSSYTYFPVGRGSSWRPGQAHLSKASCKLPLGLPSLPNIPSPKPSPCLGAC